MEMIEVLLLMAVAAALLLWVLAARRLERRRSTSSRPTHLRRGRRTGMIYNILEFGAAALFWWCCYRLWTAEDED